MAKWSRLSASPHHLCPLRGPSLLALFHSMCPPMLLRYQMRSDTERALIKQQQRGPSKEQPEPKQEELGTGNEEERRWGLGNQLGLKQPVCCVYLKGQMTQRAPCAVRPETKLGCTRMEGIILPESCDQNHIVIGLQITYGN